MNDITGIEARLEAALSRIADGVERLPQAGTGDDVNDLKEQATMAEAKARAAEADAESLRAELAEEKKDHAELSERVSAIREKQDQIVEQLEARVAKLQEQANTQARDLAKVRNVNAELRSVMQNLRDAVAEGSVGAEALNQALKSELDATRAQQTADRNELDAILAELTPLIQEKADV